MGKTQEYQVSVVQPVLLNGEYKNLFQKQNIRGELVILKGFEQYTFFIHPKLPNSLDDRPLWAITEQSTGYCLPIHKATKKATIANAQKVLEQIGLSRFQRHVLKALKFIEEYQKSV